MLELTCDEKRLMADFDTLEAALFATGDQKQLRTAAAALCGQGVYFDAFAICGRKDAPTSNEARNVIGMWRNLVSEKGMIGWFFRVLWGANDSMAGAPPDDADTETVTRYYVDVAKFVARELLHYCADNEGGKQIAQLAYLLLTGQREKAMDLLLPLANVDFDKDSVDRAAAANALIRRNRATAAEEHRVTADFDETEAESNAVSSAAVSEESFLSDAELAETAAADKANVPFPPLPRPKIADGVLFPEASEEYVREAWMLRKTCIREWDGTYPDRAGKIGQSTANVPFPWTEREYVFNVACGLIGYETARARLDEALLTGDADMAKDAFAVLDELTSLTQENGIAGMPLAAVKLLGAHFGPLIHNAQTSEECYELTLDARSDFSDLACIVLAHVPDAGLACRLALCLLDMDDEAYAAELAKAMPQS